MQLGKPYVLPCVREAEKIMMDQELDMEYAGIVSRFLHLGILVCKNTGKDSSFFYFVAVHG